MQLERFFPYKLAVVAESFSRQLVAVYRAEYGLSREEWRLLYLLGDATEIDSLALSRRTTLDKVQVSRAAQRLEEKGLIRRAIAKQDRRLRVYTITKSGKALFEQVVPKVQGRAKSILAHMTEAEKEALFIGLEALHRGIEAETSEVETEAAQ